MSSQKFRARVVAHIVFSFVDIEAPTMAEIQIHRVDEEGDPTTVPPVPPG
jgi:hypothetical protein